MIKKLIFSTVVGFSFGLNAQWAVTDPGSYTYYASIVTNTVNTVESMSESVKMAKEQIEFVKEVSDVVQQGVLVKNIGENLVKVGKELSRVPQGLGTLENPSAIENFSERIVDIKMEILLMKSLLKESIASGVLKGGDFERLQFLLSIHDRVKELRGNVYMLNKAIARSQPMEYKGF